MKNFTRINNDLIDFGLMSGLDYKELIYIMAVRRFSFKGRLPYPSQARLAKILGCSVRTVARISSTLSKHKLQILNVRISPTKGRTSNYIDVAPCLEAVSNFANWYRSASKGLKKRDLKSKDFLNQVEGHKIKNSNTKKVQIKDKVVFPLLPTSYTNESDNETENKILL